MLGLSVEGLGLVLRVRVRRLGRLRLGPLGSRVKV